MDDFVLGYLHGREVRRWAGRHGGGRLAYTRRADEFPVWRALLCVLVGYGLIGIAEAVRFVRWLFLVLARGKIASKSMRYSVLL